MNGDITRPFGTRIKGIGVAGILAVCLRILVVVITVAAFLPGVNPARISGLISVNASLFTCAVSYSVISENFVRALRMEWVSQATLTVTFIGSVYTGIAVVLVGAVGCLSFGNGKMRRTGLKLALAASALGLLGTTVLRGAYAMISAPPQAYRVEPIEPVGVLVFYVLFALLLALAFVSLRILPKPETGAKSEMAEKYRLFLMILPFLVLVALFAYLPLWGWRYAFFNFRAGFTLSMDDFAGLRWFTILVQNPATRADIVRVMRNTFAMSGIGIATSWLPMVFAIFLAEIKASKPRRIIQTVTTIPNFISWVLIYSVAFAIFSTEGFLNWMLMNLGVISERSNHLMSNSNIWLKMWLWGTWKGLGWSAIIYIAGISSIDPQLYEAAMVDGAGRFRRMWHITLPGLTSTFFVLLLLAIANVLSNGMEQYYVFFNPANRATIQVLDLYIFQLGLSSGTTQIPLATAVGMLKSIFSVTLLFGANRLSKAIRGESIV